MQYSKHYYLIEKLEIQIRIKTRASIVKATFVFGHYQTESIERYPIQKLIPYLGIFCTTQTEHSEFTCMEQYEFVHSDEVPSTMYRSVNKLFLLARGYETLIQRIL